MSFLFIRAGKGTDELLVTLNFVDRQEFPFGSPLSASSPNPALVALRA